MKTFISLSTLVLTSAGLSAQWSGGAGKTVTKITTATPGGYGVYASSDGTTKSAGIADKTAITRAATRAVRTTYARASTSIGHTYNYRIGSGAAFRDYGSVMKDRSGKGSGDAGSAAGDDKTFKKGPHSAMVNFAAGNGKEVELVIYFSGYARGNASGSTSIDVDGDGKVDFTAKTDNTARRGVSKKATIKVKAGSNGIDIKVTNEGNASLASTSKDNGAYYSTSVKIYAKAAPATYKCDIKAFGNECSGKLAGTSSSSTSQRIIKLSLTNSLKDAFGVMVIGGKQISAALPGTSCKLLVDPVGFTFLRTDANGAATQYLRAPLNTTGGVMVQDVLIKLGTKGATWGSSNGLQITCTKT